MASRIRWTTPGRRLTRPVPYVISAIMEDSASGTAPPRGVTPNASGLPVHLATSVTEGTFGPMLATPDPNASLIDVCSRPCNARSSSARPMSAAQSQYFHRRANDSLNRCAAPRRSQASSVISSDPARSRANIVCTWSPKPRPSTTTFSS